MKKNETVKNYFNTMSEMLMNEVSEEDRFDGLLPGDNVVVCRDHYEMDGSPILWEDSF